MHSKSQSEKEVQKHLDSIVQAVKADLVQELGPFSVSFKHGELEVQLTLNSLDDTVRLGVRKWCGTTKKCASLVVALQKLPDVASGGRDTELKVSVATEEPTEGE